MCKKGLAHASGTKTSSMHDDNRSSACVKLRTINRYDGLAGSPHGIDILTLLRNGTKTGNRPVIIDLATPAGFDPHNFEAYFAKSF